MQNRIITNKLTFALLYSEGSLGFWKYLLQSKKKGRVLIAFLPCYN